MKALVTRDHRTATAVMDAMRRMRRKMQESIPPTRSGAVHANHLLLAGECGDALST
jgi:hypothetical protein